jgi:hypothetical protein
MPRSFVTYGAQNSAAFEALPGATGLEVAADSIQNDPERSESAAYGARLQD